MQLSILDDTFKGTGDQRSGADLTQFKAGDKLEARIVQIASSGRTVLQFSNFRAVVDRLAGGQEGDVIRFEVLPDEKPTSGHDHVRQSSTALTSKSTGLHGQNTGSRINKTVRLNPLPEADDLRANANKTSRLISKSISQTSPFTLSTTTPAPPPAHSFDIVSTWLRRFFKTSEPQRSEATRSLRMKKTKMTKGFSQEKSIDRTGMIEAERIDRPRDSSTNNDYTLFHLGNWPVKMKIYRRSPHSHMDKEQVFFKAIFLLNLEYTGAVRTDIMMGTNEIRVEFFVENDDCRTNFARALPELTANLSSLTTHCYCHVAVSQTKIHDFLKEEGKYPVNTRFDIRA